MWSLNRKFYKTVNFWVGLFLVITNVGEVVPRDRISFGFFLDLGIFIIGIILVLHSLIKKFLRVNK